MTDSERDRLLREISGDLREIKTKLDADYRALYGNGQPGLLHQYTFLDNRVLALEKIRETEEKSVSRHLGLAAWLATAAIALYAAVFKGSG